MSSVQVQSQKKLVTFLLNNEFYAIEVNNVKEVFVPESITPIPQAADYTAGVINYRGLVVTVIDLKRRLLIEEQSRKKRDYLDDDERNYILIVNIGKSTIGLLVDYVEAVITVSESDIQESVQHLSTGKSMFIDGIVKSELGLIILLNLASIFSDFDLKELEKLASVRQELGVETEELSLTGKDIDAVTTLSDFSVDDLSDADDIMVGDEGFIREEKPKPSPAPKKKAKSPPPKEEDEFGTSPLDLSALTKPELLRIAYEMGIDTVSTKSKKQDLIREIEKRMK